MESTSQNRPPIHRTTKSDGFPDVKHILQLIKSNWYLFVISFPIIIGGTYINHRYSKNIYKASVTIMLKGEETKAMSRTALIEGIGLSPETNSLESQTLILRSKKVVLRAIRQLDFQVDMYSNGMVTDYSLYPNNPFVVKMDSSHVQLLSTPINITPLPNHKLLINIETENGALYNFSTEEYQGGSGAVNFQKVIDYGERIETPVCKFTIDKSTNANINEDVSYYFYFRSLDWLTNHYRSKISVSPLSEGSFIINVSVTGENAYKLTTFLNALSKVYLEDNLERKNDIAVRTLDFIHSQLAQISDTLKKTQKKLMEFRLTNIYSAPDQMASMLTDQYMEYEKERKILNLTQTYYTNLYNHLKTEPLSNDYLLPVFSNDVNPIIASLIQDLLSLSNEYELTRSKTDNSNPYLADLKEKIKLEKQNLITALEKLLKNSKIEDNRLVQQINELDEKMSQLPESEKEFINIDRAYKLNDALYTFLLQKQSETEITKASNAPDNEIIDSAYINGIVAPNKEADRKKALLLALLLPAAIIFLKEYLNTKIRSKSEIEAIAPYTPIYGFIPQSKLKSQNIIGSDPTSNIAESFRALRTRLNFVANNEDSKVILVTSTNTGEGKTFCALNLAYAYAITGKKTALLGFDLRKPRLTEIFNHHKQTGLSHYLINQADYKDIQYQENENTPVIFPSGAIPPNPSELISNDKTKELFEQLKADFDYVIVDSPPIGVVTDARILMDYCHYALYVVRANKTDKEHLKSVMQSIEDDSISCVGLIFNDITKTTGGYGYYSDKYTDKTNKS